MCFRLYTIVVGTRDPSAKGLPDQGDWVSGVCPCQWTGRRGTSSIPDSKLRLWMFQWVVLTTGPVRWTSIPCRLGWVHARRSRQWYCRDSAVDVALPAPIDSAWLARCADTSSTNEWAPRDGNGLWRIFGEVTEVPGRRAAGVWLALNSLLHPYSADSKWHDVFPWSRRTVYP